MSEALVGAVLLRALGGPLQDEGDAPRLVAAVLG